MSECNGWVYWIHLPQHTDVSTEGYIGITKAGIKQRYSQHLSEAKRGNKLPLYNAIRKYKDLMVVEQIFAGDYSECLRLEHFYRPTEKIGYNVAPGGSSVNLGRKHSEDSKRKISESNRNRIISKETRLKFSKARIGKTLPISTRKKMSEAQKKIPFSENKMKAITAAAAKNRELHPWQNPFANKDTWALAAEVHKYMLENPTHGSRKVARHFCTTLGKIASLFKKIKENWNPNNCQDWQKFVTEYATNSN